MAIIELKSVRKSFGALDIIPGVDLRVEHGEFVVFVGPSGSGKSTLLRLVAGLEEATGGTISIDGRDVTTLGPAERELAMVFQSYALYPHKTVRANMSFALEVAKVPREEIRQQVDKVAALLQLTNLLERKPRELSGGQRQRVAIGRAIVREPVAFMFDEPLSNLDAALRIEMRLEIAKLHRRLGATMIYVTHDQTEAMTLADRIVVLDKGVIQQTGSPLELYERPANLFVAQFIGSPKMNVLSAEVAGSTLPAMSRAATHIGIRPEDIAVLEPGKGHLDGRIEVVERLGSDTFAYVALADGSLLTVRAPRDSSASIGQEIGIRFEEGRIHAFDGKGVALPS
ncbi:ABC transporter ATP-binding protein [Rhizobium sp. P38BS-XIX]|uniref:ABC transporter ATP-binding protein n=1 Tax=Rhizobium sp. P38BS-XIX TaxID=2726740 RepID=UPI001456D200|nr:ABC transporter ATP-binding protein [Rhizobium sp. P38BS-XIX]NLS00104.1 ABC transporter ATP-binding protein [Rhizobium sp. P38BS-XIX]